MRNEVVGGLGDCSIAHLVIMTVIKSVPTRNQCRNYTLTPYLPLGER